MIHLINDADQPVHRVRPHRLLDTVISRLGLKNDAALARALCVSAARLSRIRNGYREVNADLVLRLHEFGQIPIADLKLLLDADVRLR
ncbi:hypothetical protein GCM10027277_13340 [Pseudoduganella ginsengisoli]|uniref:Helix-turn-helix domain-containing protein n=1 Tax=Pseudoduganella ginsengisoli TaxID=1462440 RepID=A0A6L6PX55_9BURK|nr:helix-turn-helix domain-containing protein [Pseudoduganella ginsengisoli]MTW01724.1 helix-turn-helix domain-containing protein [Pseudoduganella ginsengisoli]